MAKVGPKKAEQALAPVMARPDYLAEIDRGEGLESLKQFVRPARIKIVQAMSASEIKRETPEGCVIVMPNRELLVDQEQSFRFTPVFFFVEYLSLNPLELSKSGGKPMIRDRSFDPRSDVAIKARDMKMRYEPCPELPEKSIRHCEVMNFIILVHDVPMFEDVPLLLSFSRGSIGKGVNFAGLIQSRKAPLYACTFEAGPSFIQNSKGDYWALEVRNPQSDPWVAQLDFPKLQALHRELKAAHDQSAIVADYDDEEASGAPTDGAGQF